MVNIDYIRALQDSLCECVAERFDGTELEQLRVLVRLSVEFQDYLQSATRGALEPTYTCDSIFAGTESFIMVTSAYRGVFGEFKSSIDRDGISSDRLKKQFSSMFKSFVAQNDEQEKCRVLLDLFKLQIVYAGLEYK